MMLIMMMITVDVHQKCEHFGLGLGLESYGLGLVLVLPLLVLTTSLRRSTNSCSSASQLANMMMSSA